MTLCLVTRIVACRTSFPLAFFIGDCDWSNLQYPAGNCEYITKRPIFIGHNRSRVYLNTEQSFRSDKPSSQISKSWQKVAPRRAPMRLLDHRAEVGQKKDRARGDSRGRGRGGRGRGRGGRGARDGVLGSHAQAAAVNGDQDPTNAPPPPQPGGLGVFGSRLTKDAEKNTSGEQKGSAPAEGGDEVEAEVCFICASTITHQSVAPCNHRTCHICALRMRALYKTKACAHCRSEAPTVIFTDEGEKRFEDYKDSDFFRTDANLGIAYENPEIFEDTVLLLRYNCPDADCDAACLGWPDLHRHVRNVHHKVMCDLCTRTKKVFTHEHELFTQQDLRNHENFGDDIPFERQQRILRAAFDHGVTHFDLANNYGPPFG